MAQHKHSHQEHNHNHEPHDHNGHDHDHGKLPVILFFIGLATPKNVLLIITITIAIKYFISVSSFYNNE